MSNRRGFVISADLMLSLIVIFIIIALLLQVEEPKKVNYLVAADTLSIIQRYYGVSMDANKMNNTINKTIPYSLVNLTLDRYGPTDWSNATEIINVQRGEPKGDTAERVDVILDGDSVIGFIVSKLEVED